MSSWKTTPATDPRKAVAMAILLTFHSPAWIIHKSRGFDNTIVHCKNPNSFIYSLKTSHDKKVINDGSHFLGAKGVGWGVSEVAILNTLVMSTQILANPYTKISLKWLKINRPLSIPTTQLLWNWTFYPLLQNVYALACLPNPRPNIRLKTTSFDNLARYCFTSKQKKKKLSGLLFDFKIKLV